MMRALLLVLLVPAVVLLPACQSGGSADPTGQVSDGFPAPDRSMVYTEAEAVIRRQGFTIDPAESSSRRGVVKTVWLTSLQPFSGAGRRERATVTIRDVDGRPGYYRVETNVIRETNMNQKDPSNPIAAEWEQPVRDPIRENLITRSIEMRFVTGEPSERYRQRFGLPESTSPRIRTAPEAPPEDTGRAPLFGG